MIVGSVNKKIVELAMEKKQHLHLLQSKFAAFAEMKPTSVNLQVISSSPQVSISDLRSWQFLADQVSATRPDDSPIIFETKPISLEPFPDGTQCIRWSGNEEQVAAFKDWLTALSRFDYELGNPEDEGDERNWHEEQQLAVLLPTPSDRRDSHFDGVLVLQSNINEDDDLFSNAIQRRIFDFSKSGHGPLPPSLETISKVNPSTQFFVTWFKAPLFTLATAVLDRLLVTRTGPRLSANLKKNTVTFDGVTYELKREHVALVDQLIKAGGNPISGNTIKANTGCFGELERIGRVKKDKLAKECKVVADLIKSHHGKGFSIPSHYLE